MTYSKVLTAEDAVKQISNGDTVAVGGAGGGLLEPTSFLKALEKRFIDSATPRNLTFIHVTGIGDRKDGGMCHVAHEGLVKRDIGGHWDYLPKMAHLASENKIEAYNLPQGVLSQLFREIASGRPGLITHVGLKTFVDPRVEGGKLNKVTTEDIVEVINIKGEEKLFYPSFPVDIAFLRGTTADEDGNITMEEEAAFLDNLAIAQAVHNSGGKVFVQVKRLAKRETLHPKLVKIPGILVDGIVICPEQKQTIVSTYNPAYAGDVRIPTYNLESIPYNERKIIAMRAALELPDNGIVNLGVGISGSVGLVASEMNLSKEYVFAIEQGIIGGIPAGGIEFGVASNAHAITEAPSQFDFFDGGGLDMTCLGMAEVDIDGNVNVSKLGNRITGCGGFINIAQNAKKLVFCGTFTSGGLEVKISDGKIEIIKEGKFRKFVNKVNQITFSGDYAKETGQRVIFVTERAVFKLGNDGLILEEIAPGIDLHKDILSLMDSKPKISSNLKEMDSRLFINLIEKEEDNHAKV
ncbi:CoA-transferase [Priestia filamentosa]|uniref:acyl CoA:acetate/3-ketoacid CoA transferase n=1 Tax=Priestia filamentosa TaxID=1402861 RepID=UPI002E215E32|nr:CoA-transferase [Priestia filamentosa]MED3728354.1 CoA-transferase [Priestia filamentosa]